MRLLIALIKSKVLFASARLMRILNPKRVLLIGLHVVESIQADVLVEVLKDTMVRLNLSLQNCRGQCHDGAANMAGLRNGVATQIASKEPRAIFVHRYGNALNLTAGDTVKKNKLLRNTLDTTLEISKLLKFSPRRDAMFSALKSQISPETSGFQTLCPTRWTVRGCSLESILENYFVFEMLWEEVKETSSDSEMRARVTGEQATMETFEYLFGLSLGERILKHTDSLSHTIQNPSLTAFEAQDLAKKIIQTLLRIRNDEAYDLFWERMLLLKSEKRKVIQFCCAREDLHILKWVHLKDITLLLPKTFISSTTSNAWT